MRERKKHKTVSEPAAQDVVVGLCLAGVAWLGLVALSFWIPEFMFVLLIIGLVIAAAGRIMFLQIAYEDGVGTCLACLFVPLYSTYYFFKRIDTTWRGFLIGCCGYVFVLSGFVLLFVRGVSDLSPATIVLALVLGLVITGFIALIPFFLVLFLCEFVLNRIRLLTALRFPLLMIRNLRRNLIRTSLTYVATYVLVLIVVMIWSVLYFIDQWTTEKSRDLKVVVTEKWQAAESRLPFSYAVPLSEGAAFRPGDIRPQNAMTWQMYIGTLDPDKLTMESLVIFVAVEPRKILTMMDEIFDEFETAGVKKRQWQQPEQLAQMEEVVRMLESNKRGTIVGRDRLQILNKKIGDRFAVTGINTYKNLDLEFEIVGAIPPGKYGGLAFMNRDYLMDALEIYPRRNNGAKHPLADRPLDMVWLKVPDQESLNRVAEQIESSGQFQNPAVKCQTLSAAMGAIREVYGSLIWAMEWFLTPAILIVMTLVLANAISISVRERRTEIAVMKVLGYRPGQILTLILGEAVILGGISGFLCSGIMYVMVNIVLGSVQELFISIPEGALWWGPSMGAVTALAGSLLPAWSACRINVGEVFARVT